ncbi:hypothetical protein [Streptococcus loxodontisalivarius]|uniref:DNA repair ATPase RecN n=1 Tax=Streptococcus loxodontisalivarius TaxID=1349415 RepID=A0ABS2PQY7_9STRE|nr:hypothetical protein [Streptococcus loxodontisalivarius]MBM7642353.1 DNA repair ATPase RecN [Streptococcus loxodontisalivarius]
MSKKDQIKSQLQKAKTGLTKNWKKTLLISAGVLLVAGAGVAVGTKIGDHGDFEDRMETRFDSDFSQLADGSDNWGDREDSESFNAATASMTYDEWKTAINDSGLSSDDKKTFLAAIEKAKDNITKASDLQSQLEKLYTDNIEPLNTEFTNLMKTNASIWSKLNADTPDSIEDLDTDDLTDLKQAVDDSSLSSDDKSKLLKDIESLKTLKEKYSTTYASYVEKQSDLEKQLETAQNAVSTSLKDNKVTDEMIAQIFGGAAKGNWSDDDSDDSWS